MITGMTCVCTHESSDDNNVMCRKLTCTLVQADEHRIVLHVAKFAPFSRMCVCVYVYIEIQLVS